MAEAARLGPPLTLLVALAVTARAEHGASGAVAANAAPESRPPPSEAGVQADVSTSKAWPL